MGPRYRELLRDIFERKRLAPDFSLYLHRPTATDPSLAPQGLRRVLCPLARAQPARRTRLADRGRALSPKSDRGRPRSVDPSRTVAGIVTSRVATPLDFQDRLNSYLGAGFGARAHSDAKRVVPAAQRKRGRAQSLPGGRGNPSGRRPSRASCLPPAFLTRSFRMPRFLFDPSLASLSDHAECRAPSAKARDRFTPPPGCLPAAMSAGRRSGSMPSAVCRTTRSTSAPARPMRSTVCASGSSPGGEGRPLPHPADRAMADLIRRYAIPRAIPEALLEGLTWDAEGRTYETLEELFDYAARVAGTVGVMMTLMMGERSPQALARACDLGVAMQLTNIARDVGEDARLGRLYLPRQWLRKMGIDCRHVARRSRAHGAAAARVARLLGAAADALWRACTGSAFCPRLPSRDSRGGVDLCRNRPRDRTRRIRFGFRASAGLRGRAKSICSRVRARPPASGCRKTCRARARIRALSPRRGRQMIVAPARRPPRRDLGLARFVRRRARDVRAAAARGAIRGLTHGPDYYGVVEMLLSFGVVLAFLFGSFTRSRRPRREGSNERTDQSNAETGIMRCGYALGMRNGSIATDDRAGEPIERQAFVHRLDTLAK